MFDDPSKQNLPLFFYQTMYKNSYKGESLNWGNPSLVTRTIIGFYI